MTFLHQVFFSLFAACAMAQSDTIPDYPKDCFGPPLDIPYLLAGNFGEPRPGHFHMGLDIRTQEREGLPVYALADGYVSRIGVSPYGYGNALYITYPNGYTSLFGHLSRFCDTITQRLRTEQNARQEFAVDFTLKPYELPVYKGQLVAYSGNTGGSGGPHLHFEIRDMLERSINPLNFGYQVADHVAPTIGGVKFYPMGAQKNSLEPYRTQVLASGSAYSLKTGLQRVNDPLVALAVNAFDRTDEKLHSVGLYDLKLFDGDSIVFEYTVDRLSFDWLRYVIAQVDYPIFIKEGSRAYQKCYIEHNNPMPAYYRHLKNRGVIDLSDGKVHHLKALASDFECDEAILVMDLQYDAKATAFKPGNLHYAMALSPDTMNVIQGEGYKAEIPGKYLLDSVFINYSSVPAVSPGIFSDVVKIGESYDLLGPFKLSIRPKNLPENLKEKALIVWKSAAGALASKGGKWEDGLLTAPCREFGSFFIVTDTTGPQISPLNIQKGRNMHLSKYISVRIKDNLSGIAQYHGYIDGHWQLMEMDGKTSVLRMPLPSDLGPGEHIFKLSVIDYNNNQSELTLNFMY